MAISVIQCLYTLESRGDFISGTLTFDLTSHSVFFSFSCQIDDSPAPSLPPLPALPTAASHLPHVTTTPLPRWLPRPARLPSGQNEGGQRPDAARVFLSPCRAQTGRGKRRRIQRLQELVYLCMPFLIQQSLVPFSSWSFSGSFSKA